MKRFFGVPAILILAIAFASCSDGSDALRPGGPEDSGPIPLGVSADIIDGSTEAGITAGGSPYFFFLSPLVPNPDYTGVAEHGLSPTVTITTEFCPTGTEAVCKPSSEHGPLAVFSGADITDGSSGYSVVWKTNEYPVVDKGRYGITVEVTLPEKDPPVLFLGSLDVVAINNQDYNSYKNTYPDQVVISDNGSANIAFRIEEGLLEEQYCDGGQVEDCDVKIFQYAEEGCLTVFDNPDGTATIGTQACVPASSAQNNGGNPVSEFVAIMTLEQQGQTQGGGGFGDGQIPFLPDIRTIPEGIGFVGGVSMTICQDPTEVPEGVPHDALRPFIIYWDGEQFAVYLPTVYISEADLSTEDPTYIPVCDTGESGGDTAPSRSAAAAESGSTGFLSRLAQGISRATRFLQPKPLMARRRLHGGLNTVVWDVPKAREGVAGQTGLAAMVDASFTSHDAPPVTELELGAVLDIDMAKSYAVVPASQLEGEEVEIKVYALNYLEEAFPFEVEVTVTATQDNGTNEFTPTVTFDGSVYTAKYTPGTGGVYVGTYTITIVIEGDTLAGPYSNEIRPLSGPLTVSIDITGDETWAVQIPEDGLPVELYTTAGGPVYDANGTLVGTKSTNADGNVVFEDIIYGTYTVHLPKRDFDMDFTGVKSTDPGVIKNAMTILAYDHQLGAGPAQFTATALPMPAAAEVWRVSKTGNGNAYQYVASGRSWTSAQNQIRENVLHQVYGHLASVAGPGENKQVSGMLTPVCAAESGKQCKVRAWLGLTDEVVEGTFVWTDGETSTWRNWCGVDPQSDRRADNKDHVEIAPIEAYSNADGGCWTVINGASSTNDGYFVEWDVIWPSSPF